MIKKLLLIIPILFLFLITPSSVISQEVDSKAAYQDYLVALDVYRKDLSEFQNARDFYLQNKTLGLKEKARLETYDMLIARDELLAVYLTAIRSKLMTIPDHPGHAKGHILEDLVPEIDWYRSHKNDYNKTDDPIETFFEKSDVALGRYSDISLSLVYETLSTIALSNYLDLKILHERVYTPLREKSQALEGSERALLDRWITDVDSEFQKITDFEKEAEVVRLSFRNTTKRSRSKPLSIYNEFMETLNSGQSSFLAMNGFLQEMATVLKVK